MSEYQVLIFDLDDTLIDNLENVRYAYKVMVQAAGTEYSEAGFRRWYEIDKKFWRDRQDDLIEIPEEFRGESGKKSQQFLDWLRAQRFMIYFDGQKTLSEAIKLNSLFTEALKENVVALDGTQETLAYLKGKYYVIVATNGPQVAAETKLAKIRSLAYVDKVLSADMFGYMKPKREFFDAIQRMTGNYSNSEYLMIGDSLKSDVGFAMNCGFDSCWVNRKGDKLSDEYCPTMTISNLKELMQLL